MKDANPEAHLTGEGNALKYLRHAERQVAGLTDDYTDTDRASIGVEDSDVSHQGCCFGLRVGFENVLNDFTEDFSLRLNLAMRPF